MKNMAFSTGAAPGATPAPGKGTIMSASYSITREGVTVTTHGRLGFDSWQSLRDARVMAVSKQLPLKVDFNDCQGLELAGLGSLLIAQHVLGSVAITGCNEQMARWFGVIGVCEHCTTRSSSLSGCRRFAAAS